MICLIMHYYDSFNKDNDDSSSISCSNVNSPCESLDNDESIIIDSDIEIITMTSTVTDNGNSDKRPKTLIPTNATLIICPLSVISNWDEQIAAHIVKEKRLKVYIYHGPNRICDAKKLAKFDVIISTYNVLAIEYNKEKNSEVYEAPLHKINWFRIILDEAHYIKDAQTLQSRAACDLPGLRRWCLSGTPIQNKIEDLFGLIKFLGLEPFNKKRIWNDYFTRPVKHFDKIGISSLQTLMKSIAIRRTKNSTFKGKKLVDLPPKTSEYVKLQLTPEARIIYNKVLSQGKKIFNGLVKKGIWAKHYVHILEIILRLRQVATHLSLCPNQKLSIISELDNLSLPKDDNVLNESQALDIFNLLKESGENQCLFCGFEVDNIERRGSFTPCSHLYCHECLKKKKSLFTCLQCQKDIRTADVINIPTVELKKNEVVYCDISTKNVKVDKLINDLLRDKKGNEKSIVFSQWTKLLDLLDGPLKKENIKYVRLDGQMSRMKRNESINLYKNDPDVTVMLISLKAGGLGLTLTVASKVYLFEPHFNPAAENQAIDRVHRLGQKKPVFVYHYISENTIEENIIALQDKKRTLFNITFNRKKRLTKEEIENRRLADLKFLFK